MQFPRIFAMLNIPEKMLKDIIANQARIWQEEITPEEGSA